MTDPTNRGAWQWAAIFLEEQAAHGELLWIADGRRCYLQGDTLTVVNADDTVTRHELPGLDLGAMT